MAKRIHILKLKPTQLALGMLEIREHVKECRSLNKNKIKTFIKDNPVQVVRAPNGDYYIIDGHHHACILWMLGIKKVFIKISRDFSKSKMSHSQFWRQMKQRRWAHFYDQFGNGPHHPIYLPDDIRGLADDPYRSLAWLVEQSGGFNKTDTPYSDFQWANFFRRRNLIKSKFGRDIKGALPKARKLARSSAAVRLPGFKHSESTK
jgi:hypothetical protein